jgi:hypothetical protein
MIDLVSQWEKKETPQAPPHSRRRSARRSRRGRCRCGPRAERSRRRQPARQSELMSQKDPPMRRLILAIVLLAGLGAAVQLIAGFSDPAKADCTGSGCKKGN